MKSEIRQFILRALKAADGNPMSEVTLRAAVRKAFSHVAMTEADITLHIQFCESNGWIIGTSNALSGTVWTLTDKGILAAAQL